jgi:hypothetical protein
MKKQKLFLKAILCFATLLIFNQANAQCNWNCEPTLLCKDMSLGDNQNPSEPDPCPLVFCIEQQLECGGTICASYAEVCSEILHKHSPPYSQLCYRSTVGDSPDGNCAGCSMKTISVKVYRKFNGGTTFATISLTSTEITSLMNLLNGGGGSGVSFQGVLNDCEGGTIFSRVQVLGYPGGGFYTVIN